jgi:site-specific DNA recombinase
MRSRKTTSPKIVPEPNRCAIYTRKSTSVGLEQDFNSLDAQREACAAYIERQPGWTVVGERYDDGGFTGANIERPAFQRLLTDIEAAKIDVVVVYKVDRLSRSLLDFAKLMERFNRAGASFVSVTQNFSTADAMGRLTLNMLMSFAEFEREMIGERTRDKIAAARRKGKWTGGPIPLGYTVHEKRLVVNEPEAVLVREIFVLYLEQRSTLAVARLFNETNRSTKRRVATNGRIREARPWTKADVLSVIKNPVYAGYMRSHGEFYEGEHEALVDRETFSRARALLDGATRTTNEPSRNPDYLLRGLLRCACCGSAFTPASTRKGRTEYRYYRCLRRDKEGREACPSSPLPAGAIETFVIERLREFAAEETHADTAEAETSWIARCLADFEAIWDVLTPENRCRLLRAVVQSVEVDEPANRVKVFIVDLSDSLSAPPPDDVPHETLA